MKTRGDDSLVKGVARRDRAQQGTSIVDRWADSGRHLMLVRRASTPHPRRLKEGV